MRKQLPLTIYDLMAKNNNIIVLLGDIGVFSFSKISKDYPDRLYNIGIMEQNMIGVASGLSINGFIPIVHTIAPFIVERAYEQLKIDFGYQSLNGIFISVGGSYDYSNLGGTHHCPADVNLISNIPDFIIISPGNSLELDHLLRQSIISSKPKYIRLSESENSTNYPIELGKLFMFQKGDLASLIVVGNMLDKILPEIRNLDLNVFYCTTINPFDTNTFNKHHKNNKVIIIEPYYSGAILNQISDYTGFSKILSIGVPKKFIHSYGSIKDIDLELGLDGKTILKKIKEFIHE